ncbi:MAG: efflux RND transporter periplasmic adaptor subunit [Actinomycetota bacterium]
MRERLLVLAVAIALAACSGEEQEKNKEASIKAEGDRIILSEPDKATFLKTAAVQKDTGSVLRLPGRLVWNEDRTVRVFPQLGGRVTRSLAEVGAPVKAGQPLAVLASPDFGIARAEAKRAQADLALARQSLERNKELLEAGVVAKKDWQQSQAEAARAEAEADRAAKRMALLGGDGDGSYVLKSPLAGVVVERNLNPGQEFRPDQPASPLFVVTDPSSLWIQLDAGEGDLAALKPGEKFVLEAKQYPGERFEGVIRHVADFVDPTSRTVKVRGEVPNADRRLKGEMFVTALIQLPATSALHVPASAVFLMGDKRYVLVEEAPGRYRRQEVQVGPEREGFTDVYSGLKDGDKVVVEGNLHLIKFFKGAAAPGQAAR